MVKLFFTKKNLYVYDEVALPYNSLSLATYRWLDGATNIRPATNNSYQYIMSIYILITFVDIYIYLYMRYIKGAMRKLTTGTFLCPPPLKKCPLEVWIQNLNFLAKILQFTLY